MNGYERLLLAIFKPEDRFQRDLICRVCGDSIEDKTKYAGFICRSCLRKQNLRGAHSPHPQATSRRLMAQRAYPEPQRCQIKDCDKIGIRHHEDYDKPLDITWLCNKHHRLLHYGRHLVHLTDSVLLK